MLNKTFARHLRPPFGDFFGFFDMAATASECTLFVKRHIPSLDEDLSQYIRSVLESSCEDFENGQDIFEAIGGVLQEVAPDKTEMDIKNLCDEIIAKLRPDHRGSSAATLLNGGKKILDAPVHLGSVLASSQAASNQHEVQSIWIQKAEDNFRVDAKKLEKAELQLAKKADKRDSMGPTVSANRYKSNEATASQVLSRKDGTGASSLGRDIKIEGFDVAFGDKVLLKGADLSLTFGRRYGLVGRNGLGKSTLLSMIYGRQLVIPAHLSILHVEQEVVGDDTLALQSVLESDTQREGLLREEREINQQMASGTCDAHLNERLTEIYVSLERIESDSAPARAAVILAGLGFSPEMQASPTKSFSGGWRMRLALARALFCKPDLLLLDEPTNMLDMLAIIWLERYLQTWPTTLLVVSHDRNFLDQVPTDMLHLHSSRIDSYRGNYTEFVTTMTEKLKAQQREYEAQLEYRKHVQEFIDKFRYNAKRASLVQSRIKQLEKLPELKPIEKESEVVLRFPDVEKLSGPILTLSEVEFGYDKTRGPVFKNVDLSATMESRICIVGENGAGKTTLLKLVMDKLSPTKGTRSCHRNLKFGYFSQHHVDQLDMTVCSVELMQKHFPGKKVEEYRRMLGSFGVTGELALQQICSLSGGQKSRVAFAILCAHNPNFLILDEPTNHLDIQTIEALGNAILNYKGGMVLVSHDERLIRAVCQEVWVCSKGSVHRLEGGLDEYRAIVEQELVL